MNSRLQTLRDVEDELKIRLGKSSASPAAAHSWEFRRITDSVGAMMRRIGRRSHGSLGAADNPHHQRVVVKASYRNHSGRGPGLLRAHVNYLARDSASLDGKEGRFYDARREGLDAKQIVRDWQDDPRHFRWIISPENADQLERQPGGLQGYIREILARAEKELGTKLQWLAINHHNTDDLHAHVLIRGVREDARELRLPRQFVSHRLRQTAQEIASRRLGPRSAEQVQEAQKRELAAERFTAIDAVIQQHVDEERRLQLPPRGGALRQSIAARLQHLEELGLAARDRRGRWQVDEHLEARLRALGERNDVIKNLYPKLGPRSAFVSRGLPDGNPVVGYVVATGIHDELRDQMYVLVRDEQNALHYARAVNGQNLNVLEEGAIVRLTVADPRRLEADRRIAQVALDNGGTYSAELHRPQLPARFAKADVESFLRSHERRLKTLEQAGAATPSQSDWVIPDAQGLARGDHARCRNGFAFIEVICAKSVQSQVEAEAWTWLDRQLHLRSQGGPTATPFDRELEEAAAARMRWTVERGYATEAGGRHTLQPHAAAALREREWLVVESTLRQRFGCPPKALPAGAHVEGEYRGIVSLHAGLHAAVVTPSNAYLAAVGDAPPLAYGTAVRAKVSALGRTVLARSRELRQEQGLERE